MLKPSNTKIEQRALNALESIIDEHLTMGYQFNSHDKEMSWDGYIDIFKANDGNQSKDNFDDRVPVQIKGHIDEKQRYIKKDKITYAVSLDDLHVYSKEKGVLYFQIFLFNKQQEIFYTVLYPSKILDYLEKAEKRHNQNSINIPFSKLKKDPNTLYNIAKQFSTEGLTQGSAFTPLVQDRIRKEDFDNIDYIRFTAVGARTPYEILLRLSSGDVCFYGKINGDKYERPMEWQDDSLFYVDNEVIRNISVKGEIYYKKYNCLSGSDGCMVITLSPNLKWTVDKQKLDFKPISTLEEIYNDAQFLLHASDAKGFCIGESEFEISTPFKKDFKNNLIFYVKLFEGLEMIGFKSSIAWSEITELQFIQFQQIVSILSRRTDNQLADNFYKHLWTFNGKNIPIIIKKYNNDIELMNAIYTNKIAVFLPNEKSENIGYRMPLFFNTSEKILSNLYYYDYELLQRQIDESDINPNTVSALNNCVLFLINVYDLNGDYHFLDLADYLIKKLDYPENDTLSLLNKTQIKKRRCGLDDNDFALLNDIDDCDVQIKFGKYVLLEDTAKASETFNEFTEAQKEFYTKAPIYKLFTELSPQQDG